MRYIVFKERPDSLFHCDGVFLPDGYYRVFELTKYNAGKIESLERRGYVLQEETDGRKCGLYDEDTGQRVDEDSVRGALDPGTGMAIKYLADDAPEVDPMATMGMPPELFRRGYQGPQGVRQTRADVQLAAREVKMRTRARG
jgi:hypothetical protein